MDLELEVLDAMEAPISTWEGVAIAAGALVVGAAVGAGIGLLILT